MHSFALTHLAWISSWGYLIAFFGMIIEGDASIFLFGFLTQLRFFNPFLIYFALVAGAVLGDAVWYWLGSHFHRLPSFVNRWVERVAPPFDTHLKNRTFHTLAISKFTYGLHHVFLVRAGMLKLPLRHVLKVDFLASLLWILIVGSLGYFSGASFIYVKHLVKFVEVLFVLGIVGFLVLAHYVGNYYKKKI